MHILIADADEVEHLLHGTAETRSRVAEQDDLIVIFVALLRFAQFVAGWLTPLTLFHFLLFCPAASLSVSGCLDLTLDQVAF